MDWQCNSCRVWVSIQQDKCTQCGQHWAKVWKKSRSRQRQRSQSRKHLMTDKTERQAEQDTENLNVFAVKTPWVATTPNTRVSTTTPAQEEMSVHKLQSSGKDSMGSLPPEPTLPMPPTAPDANRMLEHLTGLKQAMGQLPEELEKKLLELQDASKANEKLLNHGHLNRLGKIQRQLQTTRDKVDKLDQDWKGFVGQVQERFQKHKELFLETRKQLCLTFQQKQQELVQVKAEIARASQSLMANVAEIEDLDEMDDGALQANLLETLAELDQLEEYPEDEMEIEPAGVHQDGSERKKEALRPFARKTTLVTSPTKVTKDHLKLKDHKDTKKGADAKEDANL